MYREIDGVIVESSIVFVSIFATIGLLIGATTNEFKTTYIYLGYMLYFSLPFILACSFGIVSLLFGNGASLAKKAVSTAGIASFVTGLIMLVLLASSATQTSLLPTTFLFIMPYASVPFLEFLVFALILGITFSLPKVISRYKSIWRLRNWLLAVSLVLFFVGIVVMTMSGARQTSNIAASDTAFLIGSPDFPLKSVNFTLDSSDQVLINIKSAESLDFSYVFLDKDNYVLYNDSSTRPNANIIKTGYFGQGFSFTTVATASSSYYLVMKSEYSLGTNVTYSIQVLRTENSVMFIALLWSVIFLSILMAISISHASFYERKRKPRSKNSARAKPRRARLEHQKPSE